MSIDASFSLPEETKPAPSRARFNLFLVSVLILFLELACIRWFPAHVLFLTFFTNVVLLACFLGMSLGCLAAGYRRNYLVATPVLLLIAMAAAYEIEYVGDYGLQPSVHKVVAALFPNAQKTGRIHVDVGHQASPQLVFFGTEYGSPDDFVIPMEVIAGFFFLLITLAMIGPGQVLGRAFNHVPNRVVAYSVNIFGSIVGIVLFALCAYFRLPPFWWFLLPILALGYFLASRKLLLWMAAGLAPMAVLWLSSLTTGPYVPGNRLYAEHLWSPYYRIDYDHAGLGGMPDMITVNLIGHQAMRANSDPYPAYALPHLFNRDAGQPPFKDVLIIGAGSGNDVAHALQWGAEHVDAVEIDPVIYDLGWAYHPDHPYGQKHHAHGATTNPRVTVHINDGRNFLRTTDKQYDLVVYALVDSLVLHSSQSNIRLESFLFTDQAFKDIKARLKPNGMFVTYNYFRQGWVVNRLYHGIEDVFQSQPLVVAFPYVGQIKADPPQRGEPPYSNFTLIFAGERADRLREAFEPKPGHPRFYWLRMGEGPGPKTPNGFHPPLNDVVASMLCDFDDWETFGPAQVLEPSEKLRLATDDWPFLYLFRPMIPEVGWKGIAVMGGLASVLLLVFLALLPRAKRPRNRLGLNLAMFFLGAGFMLIETKAVVQMALLFGSTWIVNSVVFFAVLVMILLANLFVLLVRPERLWPYYAGLFVTLALNAVIPLNFFLGMDRTVQVVSSCALVFAPVAFAGVVFAVLFSRTAEPDRALGANIAGAMAGGLAEYSSMLLGFQYVVLVAIAFYALSALGARRPTPTPTPAPKVLPEPVPEGV